MKKRTLINSMQINTISRNSNQDFIRSAVKEFVKQMDLTITEMSDISTAVGEAIQNIVDFAYDNIGKIQVEVLIYEGNYIKINTGKDLMGYLTNYVNNLIGKSLYNQYKEYSLLISNQPNFYVTTFKSPLRKFKDIIILHQILCLKNHLDIKAMINYMENITNMKFEEIKNYCLN